MLHVTVSTSEVKVLHANNNSILGKKGVVMEETNNGHIVVIKTKQEKTIKLSECVLLTKDLHLIWIPYRNHKISKATALGPGLGPGLGQPR